MYQALKGVLLAVSEVNARDLLGGNDTFVLDTAGVVRTLCSKSPMDDAPAVQVCVLALLFDRATEWTSSARVPACCPAASPCLQSLIQASPFAVLGPACSSTLVNFAKAFRDARLPLLSYSATSSTLNDPQQYPFMVRTVGSDANQAKALVPPIRIAPCL